jgi:hypothetical protein
VWRTSVFEQKRMKFLRVQFHNAVHNTDRAHDPGYLASSQIPALLKRDTRSVVYLSVRYCGLNCTRSDVHGGRPARKEPLLAIIINASARCGATHQWQQPNKDSQQNIQQLSAAAERRVCVICPALSRLSSHSLPAYLPTVTPQTPTLQTEPYSKQTQQ